MKKNCKQKKRIIFIMIFIIVAGMVPGRPVVVKAAGGPVIGQICLFPYSVVPTGWMVCDGSPLNVSGYPDLYARIGNVFGGDSTSFNLPNLSTKVPIVGTKYFIAVDGETDINSLDSAMGEVCLFPDTVMAGDVYNWNLCDGRTLNTVANQALYSLISTTYGGSSTAFKLPNLIAKSPLIGLNYYIATQGIYPSTGGVGTDGYIGSIELYAFSFVPGDSSYCNGKTLNKAQYSALNFLIQNNFGGDSSYFAVPNLSIFTPSIKMKYCMKTWGLFPPLFD